VGLLNGTAPDETAAEDANGLNVDEAEAAAPPLPWNMDPVGPPYIDDADPGYDVLAAGPYAIESTALTLADSSCWCCSNVGTTRSSRWTPARAVRYSRVAASLAAYWPVSKRRMVCHGWLFLFHELYSSACFMALLGIRLASCSIRSAAADGELLIGLVCGPNKRRGALGGGHGAWQSDVQRVSDRRADTLFAGELRTNWRGANMPR